MLRQDSKIKIDSIYIGKPKTYSGPEGVWRSSIYRNRISGPIRLEFGGLEGDEVSNKEHHGWPSMAVCCHSLDHYAFWNKGLELDLQPGGVGENWTLANAPEDEICIMDVYDVGTAQVQVSKPRTPCQKQGKRVGRSDWVRMTIQELRTGFYLQVLREGIVQAGDDWRLVERPHAGVSLKAVNRCVYQEYDPSVADQLNQIPELDVFLKDKITLSQARAVAP